MTKFAKMRTYSGVLADRELVFFRSADGAVPFLEWFEYLPQKVQDKCRVRLERLEMFGHELRRPEADFLQDGIYELRIGFQGINYRVLYFFHKAEVVVVSHGIQKERQVPAKDIETAIQRKRQFAADPNRFTFHLEDAL